MKKVYLYRILSVLSLWLGFMGIGLAAGGDLYTAFLQVTGLFAIMGLLCVGGYLFVEADKIKDRLKRR